MTASAFDPTNHALDGCGQRLRKARENAGLSIDDVAARLHMPGRVVRSLEAEDWSRLGAPVFVRGQVRSYSRLLGLTTAPMMAALTDVGPVEPSHLVSRTHTPRAQWWAEQIGRKLVYIILTLSLAVPAWVATSQHLAGEGSSAPLDIVPVDARSGAQRLPDPAQRTVMASMTPIATAPAPADILIRTTGESWLDVVAADGTTLERGVLPAGSERRFTAAQVARLTIGNASAVDLQSMGRRVDMAGFARTNVARFTVSSDGSLVAADLPQR
ncbi:MAG: RodZ domain-containing protein [Pseudomonadota bacterium]